MIDEDFKDLDEKEYHVSNKSILIIFIASILTILFHNLNINDYFKDAMIPFILVLSSCLIIFKTEKKNKKAYLMLLPIILIFISDLIVPIDSINKDLNILILPLLCSMFVFRLLNHNYKISGNSFFWVFKLFPKGLFSNLKYFKLDFKHGNSKKISNTIFGILFGLMFAVVIMFLLIKADDYFNAFVGSILDNIICFDLNNILIFILTFILIFSVVINILKHKDNTLNEVKILNIDSGLIKSFLLVINVVFVLFLVSELSRLTSNFLNIPIEYTYSSYAREGFFQLLFVTIINFSITMFLVYKSNLKSDKIVRWLMILLISFSIILIFNSYYRMFLYINHFGFTVLRMQVVLFLLMELIIFILLISKIFDKLKKNNALIYFIIMISFYLINLYICNDTVINLISNL